MRLSFGSSALIACMFASIIALAIGCSKDHNSVSPERAIGARGVLLDSRTNPLKTYIQANWTDSDPDATGGLHYGHIKLYAHNYTNLDTIPSDQAFIRGHFDIYMGGGHEVGEGAGSMIWLHEAANIPLIRALWNTDLVNAWIPDATRNPNGYDWFDLALHYRINTGAIPGWNPGDDTDGDGCIELGEGLDGTGQPSQANRSAQCEEDARVVSASDWKWSNPHGPAYVDFVADVAKDIWHNDDIEGFHFDIAAYSWDGVDVTRTFAYEGLSLEDYIEDRISLPSRVMVDVESYTGQPTIALANMISGSFAVYRANQKEYALAYLENVLLEEWLANSGEGLADTYKRWAMLDSLYTEYLMAGKGVVFTCYDNAPSDRQKRFSLGMFYLINHQMAFYYYRTQDHMGTNVENWQWNPWVEYNVGQPTVNEFDVPDFRGQYNTDRFFLYEDGATYDILAREYFREDNKRILILVKLMNTGLTPGAGAAPVDLPGYYRMVYPDFSLSPLTDVVTLRNNEAVIMVKGHTTGCHCDPND